MMWSPIQQVTARYVAASNMRLSAIINISYFDML